MPLALAPILVGWTHWALSSGLVGAPSTRLEWGGLFLGSGFALLAIGVAITWLLKNPPASDQVQATPRVNQRP